MYPIYDTSGNITGYYDDSFLAYNADQVPIVVNGAQAIYDPNNNILIDASAIGGAVVDPGAPPAGVSQTDWASLFSQAVPNIINGIQAWQLSQINVRRAQSGLPPLNTATYATGQSGYMANMGQQGIWLLGGAALLLVLATSKRGARK